MIRYKNKLLLALPLAAMIAIFGIASGPSRAQVPSLPNSPYNIELGAVITNSARAPATVTTAKLDNIAYVGVECTYNQVSHAGSPSTTFQIQFFDAASNTYQTLVTSGAITADATPTTIAVSPGIATSGPTGYVGLNFHLPKSWRVQQITTTGGSTVTGTIGCNLLK